jgi:hypothetical protein
MDSSVSYDFEISLALLSGHMVFQILAHRNDRVERSSQFMGNLREEHVSRLLLVSLQLFDPSDVVD